MNTTKNIKQYAVLTVVLFTLSFVTIDNAQAEEVSYDQALELLDGYEAEIIIKQSISALDDEDAKSLKRIELTKELIVYDQFRNEIPEKYNTNAIDNHIDSILTDINGKYASSNVSEVSYELPADNLAFGYGSDWDTWPSTFNCSIQQNSSASNDGDQWFINSNTMAYWWSWDYPSTFSDGTIPCPSENYDYSIASIQSYAPGNPLCPFTWSGSHDATVGVLCTGANYDNYLALVTTDAYYDDGTNFKQEFSLILP